MLVLNACNQVAGAVKQESTRTRGHLVQVRHFAAHYAGDEGLARPFSAMPSDRNLAWGDQPSSSDRPAMRHRPESGQPAAVQASAARQVSNAASAHASSVCGGVGMESNVCFTSCHEFFVLQHGARKLYMPHERPSLLFLSTFVPEDSIVCLGLSGCEGHA